VIRSVLLVLLAFFGYQTPHIRALQPKMVREKLEEVILGLFMGVLNGYLLVGSLWFYLHQAGYPSNLIVPAEEGSALAQQIGQMVQYMPPVVLAIPQVYFAVGVVFVFIIVVFV
jgi:HAMP domain-containing protein